MKKFLALLLCIVMLLPSCAGYYGIDDDDDDDNDHKHSQSEEAEDKKTDLSGLLGGNSNKNPEKEESNQETATEPQEDTNVVVVAYTIYPPYGYINEYGELVGFDIELASLVFSNLGYTVRFQEIDWTKKFDLLNNGTVDCVWNAFSWNAIESDGLARIDKADFSYTYVRYTSEYGLEEIAAGFKKGSKLTDQVNAQLELLADNGTLKELAEKYDLEDVIVTDFADQRR